MLYVVNEAKFDQDRDYFHWKQKPVKTYVDKTVIRAKSKKKSKPTVPEKLDLRNYKAQNIPSKPLKTK